MIQKEMPKKYQKEEKNCEKCGKLLSITD